MIIFILGIAVLAVFFICIIGFAMAVGNVFSSLYTCIFGESETCSRYTIPEFSEDNSTPTQKPEGFLAASQRMSALQEKHRAEMKAAERARWARKTPAEQAEAIRLRKKMIYNMLGHEHPLLPHAERLAKAEAIYQERLQSGYYG
ncbi:MAG: hypothetical protein Q4B94_01750 [Pseudomonadota bacterium]|nr:hypothetical protein [Pseudomonadota bacterium]